MVVSSSARTKIKRWLKLAGFEQSVSLGREMLQRKLKELRAPMPNDEALSECAEHLDRKTANDLMAAVGNGTISLEEFKTHMEQMKERHSNRKSRGWRRTRPEEPTGESED